MSLARLRYASLPQIAGAQNPGALLLITLKTSDVAHRASRHNAYQKNFHLENLKQDRKDVTW